MRWKKLCRRRQDEMIAKEMIPEKILAELLLASHGPGGDFSGSPVVCDSRSITPGAIFAAIPGTRNDGTNFIPQAVAAGAVAVLHQFPLDDYPPEITFYHVSDVRKAFSLLCRHRCGKPDESMRIYGVTGTNGKTTSVYLLRHLLDHADIPCGLVSTVEYHNGIHVSNSTHTTPDPQTLFPLLATMKANGCQAAAMEFSSHALAQKRLHGLQLRGAIFTNLTGDHLDYHHDMENYYQAKKELFTTMIIPGGIAAVNIDSPAGKRLVEELAIERPDLKLPTFGRHKDSGWRISEEYCDIEKCSFILSNALQAFQVQFPLTGAYNISNLAGVLTLMLCDGIPVEAINNALSEPLQVPGRLEKFTSPSGAHFFVDYAHTDDALANVLQTLKQFAAKRLIVVFGAGGDRDKSKRPRMGQRAAEFADFIILTSDNPRSEDPLEIMAGIAAGIPDDFRYEAIISRTEALRRAVNIAQNGDIVLVAGKGHENYQEIKGTKHHFDDREVLQHLFTLITG
ncbi:MAG: UDP-N-acetylmuramoyl-L-alanyl-D-glutamate--2,6-diaminopimelate ligase [Lentisphaerae bacterium]|nr:UDP-N-acetylmuramoyl-L-alanyl-D-glutamate--2,6-diaminopimelate ligase [Lentisphaerota bacterium]